MYDPSSFANPTPLAHADTSRDVLPRGGTSHDGLQGQMVLREAQVTSLNEIKNALEDLIEDNTQTPDTRVTSEGFPKTH
ncbi:hypothetical protein TNCV_1873231 [Trichonephila clavipes]|nr:hypothetical protein TNCV_1873231 [Trichonephila clavipes]